jgi:large subunit ribosomal protein L3
MARMVDSSGAVIATTLLSVGPCYVTQVRTHERDGYAAAQIGYGESKKLNRPQLGHLRGIGRLRYLREVPIAPDTAVEVGHKFEVSIFEPHERIDVVAASKGKGFAGVVRRYGFAGGPKTHGQSDRWRAPGSSGAGTTPGRVVKGTLMGGRMGGGRVTVKNLQVIAVDPERCLMAVRGAVPGPRGGLVLIRKLGEPRKAIAQEEQKGQ